MSSNKLFSRKGSLKTYLACFPLEAQLCAAAWWYRSCIISTLYLGWGFCLTIKTPSFLHSHGPCPFSRRLAMRTYRWALCTHFPLKMGFAFCYGTYWYFGSYGEDFLPFEHKGQSIVRLVSYQSPGCMSGNKLTELRYLWLICSSP